MRVLSLFGEQIIADRQGTSERKRSNSESILIAIKKYGDAGKGLVSCGENKGFI